MYYFDYLRVRKGLTVFASVIIGIIAVQLILLPFSNARDDGDATVTISNHIVNLRGLHGFDLAHTFLQSFTIPFDLMCAAAAMLVLFASIGSATSLSRQNAHLHYLLVKPASREQLALATIAIDAAGMVAAFAIALVLITLALAAFGAHFSMTARSFYVMALGFGIAIMIYGMLQAATVRMKSGGVVVGIGIAVCVALLGLDQLTTQDALPILVATIHLLNIFNPLIYLGTLFNDHVVARHVDGLEPGSLLQLATVWGIGLVSLTIAIMLRKRAEI